MRIQHHLNGLLMVFALLVAGCHGGGSNIGTSAPPAGLTERGSSVVHAEGTAIIPDTLSNSGGAITQCSVSPALPAGLTMNPQTGTITGTPAAVTNDTVYTVTCNNAAGSASTRLDIEVKATAIAPGNLSYGDSSVVYVTNLQITPNTPITEGGEITQYSVSPALPAGLSLDPQTGVITGTPTTVTAPAVYTVTGSNSVDSVQTQLNIEVQATIVAPTSLTYSDPAPVYTVSEPIVDNTRQSTGGEISQFSISPPLPVGLSINAQSGTISGTPSEAQGQTLFTVTGRNSAGSVTAEIAITVEPAVIGEWLPADALNQARFRHTATLLRDGKVLVAGGYRGGVLSVAELYDPLSNTWSTTGSLGEARQLHTATVLPDGKVLVAGGTGPTTLRSSAELFDPTTGIWSQTGSMAHARDSHTATMLPDGRVLVAGGEDDSGNEESSAELYDPASGTWAPTGSLNQARQSHTATLLADGRVLVSGGLGTAGRLSSCELYDPSTGTWAQTGSMSQARTLFAATLLASGKVLVSGGYNGVDAMSGAELYDPGAGTWMQTGNLIQPRFAHTATPLPDGNILVAAGETDAAILSSAELYDPATGTWSQTGSLIQARGRHTATLLQDGKVLAAGGEGRGAAGSAELFH
ncbi:kelch repeat-containing protein [Paraburkholderia sp. 32]|uniref:kelch repeat-containing protein n=1 Tax=Paraburkholderia sp. 32 TaxID=2991057 RepID=UPI003D24BD5B